MVAYHPTIMAINIAFYGACDMGKPKISGNLYNCAFNCALPIVLEKIQLLAEREQTGNLPDATQDPIYQNYKELKDSFAHFYGLSDDEVANFTWIKFNDFLSPYLFSAQEILFAPVFRLFIHRKPNETMIGNFDLLNQDDRPITNEYGIDYVTGKYIQINADVMQQFFYAPLGIKIELFKLTPDKNKYVKQSLPELDDFDSVTSPLKYDETLSLYLDYDGGHYELQPHHLVDNDIYFGETDSFINALQEVYLATTEDLSAARTDRALAALFIEVNRALKSKLLCDAVNLQFYMNKIRQLYSSYSRGVLTCSAVLLAIALELHQEGTEERDFYESLQKTLGYLVDNNRLEALRLANQLIVLHCKIDNLKQDEIVQEILGNEETQTKIFFQDLLKNTQQLQAIQQNGCANVNKAIDNHPMENDPDELNSDKLNTASDSRFSSFQLDYFNALFGIGVGLLVIAIVTLPPIAVLIGLTAIIPASAIGFVSAATTVSSLSLLAGLGWFACSQKANGGVILPMTPFDSKETLRSCSTV